MHRVVLKIARLLTPNAERRWLDAFEAELNVLEAPQRGRWLPGIMSIILTANLRQLWRTGPMLIASLGIAFTVTLFDYRGGTEQLSTALLGGAAGFFAFWFPRRGWQWLGLAWAGMLVLGVMGLYDRTAGSIPLPFAPAAVIIGLGLRRSFDRFQERKGRAA
jgi:hypothetical protein